MNRVADRLSKGSSWVLPVFLFMFGGQALYNDSPVEGVLFIFAGICALIAPPSPSPAPKFNSKLVALFPAALLCTAIVLPALGWLYAVLYVDGPMFNRMATPRSEAPAIVAMAGFLGLFCAGAAIVAAKGRARVVGNHRGLRILIYASWTYLLVVGGYVITYFTKLYLKLHA